MEILIIPFGLCNAPEFEALLEFPGFGALWDAKVCNALWDI